ncbi:MAG: helix-turn-helix domain-containing protein [Brevundimonas sp.]
MFGETQAGLAKLGGVSRPRVSRYESGQEDPPYRFLVKLRLAARRMGLPLPADWFFEAPAPVDAQDEAEPQP